MKLSFPSTELNKWKGRLGERAVEIYIKQNLAPLLIEKENWDSVFLTRLHCPLNTIEKALIRGEQKIIEQLQPYQKQWYSNTRKNTISEIIKVFLNRGIISSDKLLEKCLDLLQILEVSTDGFLFKLRKTNQTKSKENALSKVNFNYNQETLDIENRRLLPVNPIEKDKLPDRIPIVSGNIEIVEVKTGKANIPPYQQENYRQVVKNGFSMRYFHVDIVSLRKNHFEVKEKLIKNPEEITSFPLQTA